MLLEIKVVPGSSRAKISRWGDRLKVSVTAPPEKGKANQAVVALLSDFFSATVVLRSGASSPLKTVEVDLPAAQVEARIQEQLGEGHAGR